MMDKSLLLIDGRDLDVPFQEAGHKAFRIIEAKKESLCRNCGRTIEKGEKKLIYQMDHPTYSSSCCRECFGDLHF